MFGDRTIIPKSLQKQILKLLHQGDPGVKRMKSLARMHVYWPLMDAEIEAFVQKCNSCAAVAKNPIKTTLQSWPKSDALGNAFTSTTRAMFVDRDLRRHQQNFVLNLNEDKLRAFFKQNHEYLMTAISKEFLSELITRICG
ncbi:hypothetical protein niasHT_029052 [Heterodera trifolii]|uniref:RNA-directed DNA polymerase n=1 Tax=Heterodera trifolii TaxID=157864 RepID=A0ABD2KBX2_9BILA